MSYVSDCNSALVFIFMTGYIDDMNGHGIPDWACAAIVTFGFVTILGGFVALLNLLVWLLA